MALQAAWESRPRVLDRNRRAAGGFRSTGERVPMENALLIGLSRQMALTHELDVIANNSATIDTTGF
jgi:hypothetical protein